MTKDSPIPPKPASGRLLPYGRFAMVAVCLELLALPAGSDRAVEVGACVLLVLVPMQLGQDAMAAWFKARSDLPTTDPNGWPMVWIDPAQDAWIRLAAPLAGTLASLIPIGLYAITGHRPLLAIATIVLSLLAVVLVTTPWDERAQLTMRISTWMWLPGLVGYGAAAWWALAVAGTPWGLAVAPLAVAHLSVGLAMLRRERETRRNPAFHTPSPGWLAASLGTLLAITGGIAYCTHALA